MSLNVFAFSKALSTFDYFVYTIRLKVTQYVHLFKKYSLFKMQMS